MIRLQSIKVFWYVIVSSVNCSWPYYYGDLPNDISLEYLYIFSNAVSIICIFCSVVIQWVGKTGHVSVTCCSKGYEGYLPLFGNWYVTSFYKFSWCLDFLKMKILSLFEGITRTDTHTV